MAAVDCQNATPMSRGEAESFGYSSLQSVYFSICLPLILGIGVISNLTFLYVFLRVTFMHTVTGCYLANLAFADMTFLIAAVIPKVIRYLSSPIYRDDTPIGIEGCILGYVLSNTSYFASLLFVTYVSWERFRAVCHPHRKPIPWAKITALVVLTWIVCFFFSLSFIPAFAKLNQQCFVWPEVFPYSDWPSILSHCMSVSPLAGSYANGAQTTPFFVCFIVNILLYRYIIRGLRNASGKLHKHSNEFQQQRPEKDRFRIQITRMLLINSVLFFLLFSPFEFLSLSRSVREAVKGEPYAVSSEAARTVDYAFRVLAYTNSIINPIVYTLFSSRFREAFVIAFCGKFAHRKGYVNEPAEPIRTNSKSSTRFELK